MITECELQRYEETDTLNLATIMPRPCIVRDSKLGLYGKPKTIKRQKIPWGDEGLPIQDGGRKKSLMFCNRYI